MVPFSVGPTKGTVNLSKESIFYWAKGNIPFSRRSKLAAMLQMIDSSAADNSWYEVNVDSHERGYESDCE
jgi:hypothetical protein